MGLLNQRTRLLDSILTDEGRRQLGTGQFVPAYYSFSDAGAVYSTTDALVTGSAPTDHVATAITFEAFPLPQDQVAYEADDSGGLKVAGNNNYFSLTEHGLTGAVRVIAGKLVKGWENGTPEVLSSSAQFASIASTVLGDVTNNFRKLMLLKSPDLLHQNRDEFRLNTNSIEFHVSDNTTLNGWLTTGDLDASENLFSDRRLSHVDNFSLLPPINKGTLTEPEPLGNYAGAVNGNRQILTYSDLKNEFMNIVVADGTVQTRVPLQKETIYFSETSITNRLMCQVFEIAQGQVTKLDVIDFGVFTIRKTDPPLFPDAIPQPLNPDLVTATTKIHIFWVGKVLLASDDTHRYCHLFSLCFQG